MITTSWSKTNRFYTACTYGLIAYNIYVIVLSVLNSGESKSDIDLKRTKDPSGILKLLFRITQVLVVGIRKIKLLFIL